MAESFTFSSTLFRWSGDKASWYFISLPAEIAEDINNLFGHIKRGWGSLPVRVTIGKTTWSTSIFPDKKSGSYLLPVKASVRKAESVVEDDDVDLVLRIEA